MRMTEVELIEAEKRNMLKRLRAHGWPLKARKRAPAPAGPSVKALKEAGMSARDIAMLQTGNEHEIRSAAEWGTPFRMRPATLPAAIDAALTTLQEAPREVPAKTEGREAMLRRIVYGDPLPAGLHEKVAKLLTGRRDEPTLTPSGEDLHTRLRRAATR